MELRKENIGENAQKTSSLLTPKTWAMMVKELFHSSPLFGSPKAPEKIPVEPTKLEGLMASDANHVFSSLLPQVPQDQRLLKHL